MQYREVRGKLNKKSNFLFFSLTNFFVSICIDSRKDKSYRIEGGEIQLPDFHETECCSHFDRQMMT